MWLSKDEFAEILANYLEGQDDKAATKLHSITNAHQKQAFRMVLSEIIQRILHGLKVMVHHPSTRA